MIMVINQSILHIQSHVWLLSPVQLMHLAASWFPSLPELVRLAAAKQRRAQLGSARIESARVESGQVDEAKQIERLYRFGKHRLLLSLRPSAGQSGPAHLYRRRVQLAGWLAGWLACWLAGLLADCQLPSIRASKRLACRRRRQLDPVEWTAPIWRALRACPDCFMAAKTAL